MDADVKPCPFCGHAGLSFTEGSTFRWLAYNCDGCGVGNEVRIATVGKGNKVEWRHAAVADAIREWNTRTEGKTNG